MEVKEKYGYTALDYASRNGHSEVVAMLRSMSARIKAKGNDGAAAQMAASGHDHDHSERVEQERKADLVAAELLREEAEAEASKKGKAKAKGKSKKKKQTGGAQGNGAAGDRAAEEGCGSAAGEEAVQGEEEGCDQLVDSGGGEGEGWSPGSCGAVAGAPAAAEEVECCVCLESRKSHIFIPCGHFCACQRCADEIMAADKLCPMCRHPADKHVRVYG